MATSTSAGKKDKREGQVFQSLQKIILSAVKHSHTHISIHSDDEAFAKAYIDESERFFHLYRNLKSLYTNMKCSNNAKRIQDLRILLLATWNEIIRVKFNERLQKIVRKTIRGERNGVVCEPWLVTGVRESYVNLGLVSGDKLSVYRECFEEVYFEDTKTFYRFIAPVYRFFEAKGVENYMKYAELRLAEEDERGLMYLESCSHRKLMEICADLLVLRFKSVILDQCAGMIARNEVENLQRMYRLMTLVTDGVPKELEEYIFAKENDSSDSSDFSKEY